MIIQWFSPLFFSLVVALVRWLCRRTVRVVTKIWDHLLLTVIRGLASLRGVPHERPVAVVRPIRRAVKRRHIKDD